jgi:hypothetical protein
VCLLIVSRRRNDDPLLLCSMQGSGGGIGYIHVVEVLLDRICTEMMDVFSCLSVELDPIGLTLSWVGLGIWTRIPEFSSSFVCGVIVFGLGLVWLGFLEWNEI